MKKKPAFLILLILVSCLLFSCSKNSDVKNQINNLHDQAWSQLFNDRDSAKLLSRQLKDLSNSIHYKPGIVQADYVLGYAHYLDGEYFTASQYYFSGLKVLKGENDKESKQRKLYLLQSMGVLFEAISNHQLATDYYLKALDLAYELNIKHSISSLTYNIGVSNYKVDNFNQAHEYYFTAAKLYKDLSDTVHLAKAYNSIANVYNKEEKYENALNYYNQAINLLREYSGEKDYLALYIGNLGENAKEQGNFTLSEKYYEEAIRISESRQNNKHLALLYADLGDLKNRSGNTLLANEYYTKSISKCDTTVYSKVAERCITSLITNYNKLNQSEAISTAALQLVDQRAKLQKQVNQLVAQNNNYQIMMSQLENERNFFQKQSKLFLSRLTMFSIFLMVSILFAAVGITRLYQMKSRKKSIIREMEERTKDF